MKKVLIIGASVHQLQAILKARELGFQVGVVDYNPEETSVPYADVFFNVSTIDIEGIIKTAKKFKPLGILTTATDMPMRAIATATTELGLPGISLDTALKATDKGEMIKAFKAGGVETPWFFIVAHDDGLNEIKNKISFPCIMKPTDNAASRGVILVNGPGELKNAYAYSRQHSRGGCVIIEEYLTGTEVSVEIMAVQGKTFILAVTDKLTTGPPYFVEMGHCQPSQLPDTALKKIKDLAQRAVQSIGIENGPAHVEIMLTQEGPKMIELGARMGGDFISSHLVPLSTGIDMMRATIEVSTGQTPDLIARFSRGSAIRFFDACQQGHLTGVSGIDEAKKTQGVKEVGLLKNIGVEVCAVKNSLDRIGYVVAQAHNATDAVAACNKALRCITVAVRGADDCAT